jgi:hypothetical protein
LEGLVLSLRPAWQAFHDPILIKGEVQWLTPVILDYVNDWDQEDGGSRLAWGRGGEEMGETPSP